MALLCRWQLCLGTLWVPVIQWTMPLPRNKEEERKRAAQEGKTIPRREFKSDSLSPRRKYGVLKGSHKGTVPQISRMLAQAMCDAMEHLGDERGRHGFVGYLTRFAGNPNYYSVWIAMLTKLLPSKIEHAVELSDNRATEYPTLAEIEKTMLDYGLPIEPLYKPLLIGSSQEVTDAEIEENKSTEGED
jgi:hypothetical protein